MSDRITHVLAVLAFSMAALPAAIFAQPPSTEKTVHGLDPSNLDPSVMPSVDFYQYAVGGWLKNTRERFCSGGR